VLDNLGVSCIKTGEELCHNLELHDVHRVERFEEELLLLSIEVVLIVQLVDLEHLFKSVLEQEALVVT
jgi:uncharacterized protein YqfB (UPF0267 family)